MSAPPPAPPPATSPEAPAPPQGPPARAGASWPSRLRRSVAVGLVGLLLYAVVVVAGPIVLGAMIVFAWKLPASGLPAWPRQ